MNPTPVRPSPRAAQLEPHRREPATVGAVALAIIATGLVALGTRAALTSALARRETWARAAESVYLPRASALRVLGLGHHEMLSDLVAARANVYFGAQLASHGEQRSLERALTTAIDLDPRFHRLYLRAAAMLVYTGQDITSGALLSANRILDRGAREFPEDWELPFQRGFNLLFELPKLAGADDPRVAEWRQQGVDALRQASRLEGAPPWLANLTARMLTREGGEELAIRHLEQTYALTSNEETRTEIARRLAALRGHRRAAELEQAAGELRREIDARYPYAPESFSLVAGPRQFSRFDELDPAPLHGPQPLSPQPQSPQSPPPPTARMPLR